MPEERRREKLARREESSPIEQWMSQSPWEMMQRMREDMNRLFWQFGMPTPSAMMRYTPAVDVSETDSEVRVKADLPGIDPANLDVQVQEDALTISGEMRREEEQKEEGFYRTERQYGSFTRTIDLPQPVRGEEAKAVYRNGVLEITLPKQEEARRKSQKIQVESGEQAQTPSGRRRRKE